MSDFDVKIVELPPMTVASFLGFSNTPEVDAITAANTWLHSHGLLEKGVYRIFGFNNPPPSLGSPKYGYEIWIIPEEGLPLDENVEIKEFPGGWYAVSPCNSVETIREDWRKLITWRDASEFQSGNHQGLEEMLSTPSEIESLRFLLYLPISK